MCMCLGGAQTLEGHWTVHLVKRLSYRFSKRLCLKKIILRPIIAIKPHIKLWLSHALHSSAHQYTPHAHGKRKNNVKICKSHAAPGFSSRDSFISAEKFIMSLVHVKRKSPPGLVGLVFHGLLSPQHYHS